MRETGTRLQRLLGKPASLEPGQYAVVEHETMAGVVKRIFISCPNCGGVDELGGSLFDVDRSSGLVSPRWKCPTATCPALTRLTLEAFA